MTLDHVAFLARPAGRRRFRLFIYSVLWFAFCVVAVIFCHIWQECIMFSLLWLVIVLTGNFLLASWLLLIILEISWSRPSHQRKAMVPQYSLLCLRASLCMIRAVACSPNLLSLLQMELNLQAHKKVSYLREAWTLCWFELFTWLNKQRIDVSYAIRLDGKT